MNDTAASAPGASLLPETTDMFTIGAFVLIALLMALAIAAILYGMRLARRRRLARAETQTHNDRIEAQAPPIAAAPSPLAPEARTPAPAVQPQPAPVVPPQATPFPAPIAAPQPTPVAPAAPRPVLVTPAPAPTPAAPAPAPEHPASVAQPAGPSPADGPITQLKGLGPKVATRLGELGVTTVGQLAALTDDDAQALDAHLGPFTGRMARDRWQEQARFLAAGDVQGFEAVFGRL